MELFVKFILFVGKVLFLSFAEWYIVANIFPDDLPAWVVKHFSLLSLTFNFGVLSFYNVFIYPFFVTPLRKLPTVEVRGARELTIVMETPRGISPLTWMKNSPPNADLLHLHGLFNESRLIAVSPAALRDILNTNTYDFEKPWGIRAFLARVIGFGLILSEAGFHKKQRKALTPAFHIRKIRDLYGLMWEKTNVLLEELQKDINAHPATANFGDKTKGWGLVEMSQWGSRLTLDIIGPTAIGRDFQSLQTEEHQIAEAFLEILRPTTGRLAFLGAHFIIPQWFMRILPLPVNKMLNHHQKYLRSLCLDIVAESKRKMFSSSEKGEAIKEYDILSTIIATNEFSDEEVVDQMLTFLAAGHETTASALTWTCYLLCQHPEIQKKLRDEVRERIPSASTQITHDLLEGMPYLNGVVEEVLRLFPTVPATIRQSVKDTHVAGNLVPKDTLIIISPYAVNRNPHYWGEDSEKIRPERWIDDLPNGTQRPNKHGGASSNFNEITFLHGPRACIGRDFAKAELRCAIAGVFGRFEMEMAIPNEKLTIAGVITTKPVEGMKLHMKPVPGW